MTEQKAPELLPCPFCGANGSDIDDEGWCDNGGRHGPQCQDCGATAASKEIWNKRADLSERYRSILKGVHGALTDAGYVPVPGLDEPLYDAVMQIVRERDRYREALQSIASSTTYDTNALKDFASEALAGKQEIEK